MNLHSIISTPYRVIATCLQHPSVNKKNLIKATCVTAAGVTVAAIGALILNHSSQMSAMRNCLQQSAESQLYTNCRSSGITSSSLGLHTCPIGYREFRASINHYKNEQENYSASLFNGKGSVSDLIADATANKLGIFTAYEYSSKTFKTGYEYSFPYAQTDLLICRKTIYSAFKDAMESLHTKSMNGLKTIKNLCNSFSSE